MTKAIWNGTLLAQSDHCRIVEGHHYFPPESVRREYLLPSATRTRCAWKGTAHYFHIMVGERRNEDGAWCYPEPKAAAAHIKGAIAFWKGVHIEP